jgi:hypothetical protein
MPSHNHQPALQTPVTPASPASKAPTAKYSNKDGTKTITVPKSAASTPPAQPSPTTNKVAPPVNAPVAASNGATEALHDATAAPTVNRKKQKRRAKAAAKAAAEAEAEAEAGTAANGLPSPASSTSAQPEQPSARSVATPRKVPLSQQERPAPQAPTTQNTEDWDDETESEDGFQYHGSAGHAHQGRSTSHPKKSKKKKKRKAILSIEQDLPPSMDSQPSGISKEKIWNTSSHEERERIKQFWLGLGEDERKSLVKVEKDAVLKKMKEQQKHTCSCSVCGRKRTAIEEELEGLYDAYYEELESFANQPQNHPDGPPMLGNHRRLGQMAGLHPPRSSPASYPSHHHHPSRGRIVEHVDNDDEEEEVDEYSDEDDLEEVDEDDEPEEIPRDYANDFFNFGNSLTVQGNLRILLLTI